MIRTRARAALEAVLGQVTKEPVVTLAALYAVVACAYKAITGDLADGSIGLEFLLPALGALGVRLVAAVPRLQDVLGVWSPASAQKLADTLQENTEAAVVMAEALLLRDTVKPPDEPGDLA